MLMSLQWIHWTDIRDLISAICLGRLLLSRDTIVLGVLSGRFIRYRWGLLELERVTEDSKPWFTARSVTDKFMAQSIATFAAAYLVSSGFLFNFRDRIFVESLIKCGPRGLMLVFGCTREELVATLGTDINPRLEMILVFLPSPKCREHLVLVEKLLSLPTKQQEAHTTTRTVQYYPNCRI